MLECPLTHFPWHFHTIKYKGQWYWNKQRQFHSFALMKASDPSYYHSLRPFLFLISRCSSLFYFKEMTVATSLAFSFSSAFSLHKAAVNVFLCAVRREWHFQRWSGPQPTLVAQVVSGLGLCVWWKDMKSQLFKLSQAVDFGEKKGVFNSACFNKSLAFFFLQGQLQIAHNVPPETKQSLRWVAAAASFFFLNTSLRGNPRN